VALYDAFVSYSHAKDKPVATALQSVVQKLGKPWYRRRALRVFRDDTSLAATPHLWPTIEQALGQSRFLILFASREAAASPWVNKEVAFWLERKPANTLLIAVTSGALAWDGAANDFVWNDATPLPPVLKGRFPVEPKWVDLTGYRAGANPRDSKFLELAADFAAAIRGIPKEDLLSQELRQQRRALTLAWSAAASLLVLTGLAAWLWSSAVEQKRLAQSNERQAVEQRDRALLVQSQFLADLSNQHTAAGDAVTGALLALEALPDAAQGIARPYAPEAEVALNSAARQIRERFVLAQDLRCCPNPPSYRRSLVRASFNRDSSRAVTISYDGMVQVWDVGTGRSVTRIELPPDFVMASAMTADGRLIAVAQEEPKTITILDGVTGRSVAQIPANPRSRQAARALAFSPDSRFLASGDFAGAYVWNSQSGELVAATKADKVEVGALEFSPDGRRLLTTSYFDKVARVWDAATGDLILTLSGHADGLNMATFNADGSSIVSASNDNTARIWNAETGELVTVLRGHEAIGTNGEGGKIGMHSARFSPDGRRVVTTSFDRTARIWDARTGVPLLVIKLPMQQDNWTGEASFDPAGNSIVTASQDGIVRTWDATSGTLENAFKVRSASINQPTFDRQGKMLLAAARDGTAYIWNVGDNPAIGILNGHDKWLEAVAFSPDGRRLVTASADATAKIWNVETRALVATLSGHRDSVLYAEFSPDGSLVATTSRDKTVRIWDAGTGRQVSVVDQTEDAADKALFGPDGSRVFTVSPKKVEWRDVRSGELVKILTATDGIIRDAALSGDGQRMVVVRDDNSAVVIDVASGATKLELRGEGEGGQVESVRLGMQAAAFDPDGRRIATVSGSDWTCIWDAETGALLAKLPGKYSPSVSFSPDGRRIMTADGGDVSPSAVIIDGATGQNVNVLKGHEKRVTAAAYSGGGLSVATASFDGTARIWSILPTTQALVDDVKTRVPRCLTPGQRQQFHLGDAPPRWCITGAARTQEADKDKWQGLWPFDSAAWRDWLAAADAARARGGPLPEIPASK